MTVNVVVKNYGHPVKVTAMDVNPNDSSGSGYSPTVLEEIPAGENVEKEYVAYVGRAIYVEEIEPSEETSVVDTHDAVDPATTGAVDANTEVVHRDISAA